MQTQLFLFRHGVTPANKENRFAGRTNEPLHRDGEKQIEQVAKSLCGHKITKVFCGPSTRTMESAEILSAITGAPVCPATPLDEINLSHWDGLTKQEIRSNFGDEYPTWLEDPANFHVPGCETLAQVQSRAVSEVERILVKYSGKKIALISHLIVLRCLTLHYLNLELKNFREIKINNGDLTLINRSQNGKTTLTVDVIGKNPLTPRIAPVTN